jgi:spore coat protein CotH
MKRLMLLCWIIVLGLPAVFPLLAAEGKKGKPELTDDGTFSEPKVLQFKIEIPAAGLEALKKEPKEYVKGTIREGEKTYSAVGIRYKGGDAPIGANAKPSFTVKFNEFITDQVFHGQRKITLDACPADPTFLTEMLANDLFRAAGVPAPRCAFARIEFNGTDHGLYLLSEGINRDFLARHFDKTKGNFYEGTHRDIAAKLDKDSGDEGNTQAEVAALAQAAQELDPAKRWKQLQQVLDLDGFLSFLALEVITWHTNGYSMSTNKYRLYHDPAADQMVFMPHGIDVAFSKTDGALSPDFKGLVARAVMTTPEGKTRYRERMAKLLATSFKPDHLAVRINDLAGKIRPHVARGDSAAGPAFDQAAAQLKERLKQRAAFLDQQLKQGGK